MEDLDRIKSKVAKLMNLAEKSSNEHEAANAMSKARSLMDKYDLQQFDIIEINGIKEEFLAAHATRAFKACPQYMADLAVWVGTLNDCKVVFEHGHPINFKENKNRVHNFGKIIVFRGYKRDAEMAVDMYTRLIAAVNGLCRAWLDANGHVGKYPVGIGGKFKSGAVDTICMVLSKAQSARELLKVGNGTGLVVVKGNAIAEHFGATTPGKKRPKPKAMNEEQYAAYLAGLVEGQKVEVQKSLD